MSTIKFVDNDHVISDPESYIYKGGNTMSNNNDKYLDMHREIIEKVDQLAEEIEFSGLVLEDGQVQELISQLKPISSVIDFPIDAGKFKEHTEVVTAILKEHQPELAGTLENIKEVFEGLDSLEPMIEATKATNFYYFEDLARANRLNTAILQFIVEMSYRPFIKAFAKLAQEKSNFQYYKAGYCPVCGEGIRLVKTAEEEDIRREACCTRCDTVWEVKRLKCPRCENEDHHKLTILSTDASETRKLHVCEVCKGYTKLINTKGQIKQDSFFLIDLETIYLDMIATEQGYTGDQAEDTEVQ